MKEKSKSASIAEQLALQSCEEVELPWGESKGSFYIRKINFMELLGCGRFQNLLLSIGKGLVKTDENAEPVDPKKTKAENDAFLIELAQKSMIYPSYTECADALRKLYPGCAESEQVLPENFMLGLFKWYLSDFDDLLKKKMSTLKGSGVLQNIGASIHPTIATD
jgi:hypothetical protein